jgi:gamma-glutamyl-gamma-aminobutyrate hydrolase PuuD
MKKLNIYIVGGGKYNYKPFEPTCNLVEQISDADIIIFTGGADIDPIWYGCEKHPLTSPHLSRDIYEVEEYKKSFNYPRIKLRIGFCRGGQLLAALSGAKLVQDVTNHCVSHMMINKQNESYRTVSLHHQMIYPFDLPQDEYDIIYWSLERRSSHYLGDKIDKSKINVEPEVIYFEKTKSLCIQGHPEMMDPNCDTVIMFNKLVKNIINENH